MFSLCSDCETGHYHLVKKKSTRGTLGFLRLTVICRSELNTAFYDWCLKATIFLLLLKANLSSFSSIVQRSETCHRNAFKFMFTSKHSSAIFYRKILWKNWIAHRLSWPPLADRNSHWCLGSPRERNTAEPLLWDTFIQLIQNSIPEKFSHNLCICYLCWRDTSIQGKGSQNRGHRSSQTWLTTLK